MFRIIYRQQISANIDSKIELSYSTLFEIIMEDNYLNATSDIVPHVSEDLPIYLDKFRHLQLSRVDRTERLKYFKEASNLVECTDNVFCSTKFPSIDSNILHFCAVHVELSKDEDVVLFAGDISEYGIFIAVSFHREDVDQPRFHFLDMDDMCMIESKSLSEVSRIMLGLDIYESSSQGFGSDSVKHIPAAEKQMVRALTSQIKDKLSDNIINVTLSDSDSDPQNPIDALISSVGKTKPKRNYKKRSIVNESTQSIAKTRGVRQSANKNISYNREAQIGPANEETIKVRAKSTTKKVTPSNKPIVILPVANVVDTSPVNVNESFNAISKLTDLMNQRMLSIESTQRQQDCRTKNDYNQMEERLTAVLERSTTKLQEAHQVHLQQALQESNKLKQQQQEGGCMQPIFQPQQSLLASSNSNLMPASQQGYVQTMQPIQSHFTTSNGYVPAQQQRYAQSIQPVQTVLTSAAGCAIMPQQQQLQGYAQSMEPVQTVLTSAHGCAFMQQQQQQGYVQSLHPVQTVLASSNSCSFIQPQHQQGYAQPIIQPMQTVLASGNGCTFIQPQHQQPGYAQSFQPLQSVVASSNGCAVMQHQQGYMQSLQPVQTVGNGYNLMQQQQQGYVQPVQSVLTSSNACTFIQPQQGYAQPIAHQSVVSSNGVFFKVL